MKILLITHNWQGEGTYVRAMMLATGTSTRGIIEKPSNG